jgi:hypothetical protein
MKHKRKSKASTVNGTEWKGGKVIKEQTIREKI